MGASHFHFHLVSSFHRAHGNDEWADLPNYSQIVTEKRQISEAHFGQTFDFPQEK
jgi:alpha-D-ribose 1-methylphosphonate 5-triphosphate diphosphatase PhnM